jgi:hypothetical protein
MFENQVSREKQKQLKNASKHKKPYLKPAFRHERVFETTALSCGKIDSTQTTCVSSRKSS